MEQEPVSERGQVSERVGPDAGMVGKEQRGQENGRVCDDVRPADESAAEYSDYAERVCLAADGECGLGMKQTNRPIIWFTPHMAVNRNVKVLPFLYHSAVATDSLLHIFVSFSNKTDFYGPMSYKTLTIAAIKGV